MVVLRRLLLVALILAGAAYGGLRVWIYHQYKGGIDQAVTWLSPFAAIHYGDISVSLEGLVRLRDVTVTPQDYGETFHAEAVVLQLPGIRYVFDRGDLQPGQLPVSAGISVRGLRLDFDGETMRRLAGFLRAQAEQSGGATGCGDLRYIGPVQLRAMGYDGLTLDADAHYRFVTRGQGVRVHVRFTARNMWRIDSRGVLVGPTRSIASILPGSRPLLQSLTIDYRDESYASRLVKYCAGLDGRGSAAAIAELAAAHADGGIVPGPGLVAARTAMLTHPGTARIRLAPKSPVALASLALYRPRDLVRLLNLTLSVNGIPITAPLLAAGS